MIMADEYSDWTVKFLALPRQQR